MEFTESVVGEGKGIVETMSILVFVVPTCEVYTDEVANQKGVGIGIVLITPEKLLMEKSLQLGFLVTNNEAEYEAQLAGMTMVKKLKGEVIELYLDSQLVISQVNGEFGLEMNACRLPC